MDPKQNRPGPLMVWILAARPRTLSAAAAPVLVGTAAAAHDRLFAAGPAIAALFGAVFIQIGTNFANDYFDARKGADKERIGPLRVTQAGFVSPTQMRRAVAVAFGLALLCGIYLVLVAGWPILVIGILSLLCGLAYTGGPFPIGYLGLGDLFVFLFFGLIAVTATYYVQALRWATLPAILAVPIGSLSVSVLVVNNLRDFETDRRAGKRTLVARFGRRFGQLEYLLMLLCAYVVVISLVLSGTLRPWALLPLLSVPLCVPLLRLILGGPGATHWHHALAGTARLLLVFGVLLSVGVFLS